MFLAKNLCAPGDMLTMKGSCFSVKMANHSRLLFSRSVIPVFPFLRSILVTVGISLMFTPSPVRFNRLAHSIARLFKYSY